MDYKYIAFNTRKEFISGVIAAEAEEEAESVIQNQNLEVVSLTPVRKFFNPLQVKLFEEPLSQKDSCYFIRQMGSLLSAGVPIVRALSLIRDQAPSQNLRDNIGRLIREILGGSSLSLAMQKQRKSFSNLTVRLIEMGERSGNLEEIMNNLLFYIEKEMETRNRIKKALTYPAILVAMAILVFVLMITVIMPPFLALFQQLGTELPLPTRIVMGIAQFPRYLTANKLLFLLPLFLVGLLYLRSKQGRAKLDLITLKIPVLGKIILAQNFGRIARNLAIQLKSGMNLTEGLQLTGHMTSNTILKKEIYRIRKAIMEGETLYTAVQESAIFPDLMKQIVQIGEEAGKLESNLTFLAESFDKEASERIDRSVAMIEPAMTIVIGALVTLMALAIVTPGFTIAGTIK